MSLPTHRSAALTIGVARTTFNAHLHLIEEAAGFAVFDHRKRLARVMARGQPHIPHISEAKRLIALLGESCEPHQEG
ncbi:MULTISPECIES: hypothetical protein [unclassified Streptomyces]|uniref:hypothetical protein n=1 Tax=unclassified Streptomyces TaxID=2593676 RepID=UPI0033EDA5B4